MALHPTEIIKEQTDAVTTVARFPVEQKDLPATIFATNLGAAETVAVLFSVDKGVTFEPLAQDGADLTLTLTANVLNMQSPMLLGFTKTATAGTAGVFIMTTNPKR